MKASTVVKALFITLGLCLTSSCSLLVKHTNGEKLVTESSQRIPALFLPKPGGIDLNINYKWEVPQQVIDRLPKTMPIYRFVVSKDADKDFRRLANQLQIKGEPEKSNSLVNRRLFIKEDRKQLVLETDTGMWSYSKDELSSTNINTKSDGSIDNGLRRISDEKVAQIAKTYLKKNGWLPNDFKLRSVTAATEQADPKNLPKILKKTAYFYQVTEGNTVYGVSRIFVDVSNNGQVIGVSKYYKDIVPAGNVPLEDVRKAFESFLNNEGTITTDDTSIKTARIKDVKVIYWEDGGSVRDQPFLQPVYVFKAEGQTKDGTKKFEGIVSATSKERILPEEREPDAVPTSFGPKLKQ